MAYAFAVSVLVAAWVLTYRSVGGTRVSRSVAATMVTWAAGALPALVVFALAGGELA